MPVLPDKQFILDRVATIPEAGCWLWARFLTPKGYGQTRFAHRNWFAHRLSYTVFIGPIEDGKVVAHKCDTPSCVNPEHLFVGTQAENLADMRNKNRGAIGEMCNSVLTDEKVLYIRNSRLQHKQLAKEIGCDAETIRLARIGERWSHLPGQWVKPKGKYYYAHPEGVN